MADFNTTYTKFIQPNEGYLGQLVGDKGGLTYGGIAYNFNPSWEGWPTVNSFIASRGGIQNIKNNTRIPQVDSLVVKFYKNWWDSLGLSAIKSQDVANIIFDWIVNSGERTPTKLIQKIVGVSQDGNFGPMTIEAINKMNAAKLNNAIKVAREAFYYSIATGANAAFLKGWLNRLNHFPTLTVQTFGIGLFIIVIVIATFLTVYK